MAQMNNILRTLFLYLSIRPTFLTHCGEGVGRGLWRVSGVDKGQFGVSPLMNSESFITKALMGFLWLLHISFEFQNWFEY